MRFGIGVASNFNPKARLWVNGRRNIFARLEQAVAGADNIIWVHSASLGEFEQGRPLIEAIRSEHPECKILLTFFSPSGYEIRKDYKGVNWVFYLPADTPSNARRFVQTVRPVAAIFIKYEFWLNYLEQLDRAGSKLYLVSAIFRPTDVFFKRHGEMFRRALRRFTMLFVQNDLSVELLRSIGVERVVKAGDTRFDRVAEIAKAGSRVELAERFVAGARWIFVAGSTWGPDEEIIGALADKWREVKFVVAPHQIEASRMERLEAQVEGRAVRYTECGEATDVAAAQMLIVDTIGVLSKLYRYGNVAYIGGGFGVGIHNTLEAATFGLPIAFGPNYHKFQEAKDMIALGAACCVTDAEGLDVWFGRLHGNSELYDDVCRTTRDYVLENIGATRLIMNEIFNR